MLTPGGIIVFDDSYMPSVHRIIKLLTGYYGFREVDYGQFGQGLRLRLWHFLVHRTIRRPYRALVKPIELKELPVSTDWNFDVALA